MSFPYAHHRPLTPITPAHSPHPSAGSIRSRTPGQLSLHEYRKEQVTPSPPAIHGQKTVKRKAAASSLKSFERLPPESPNASLCFPQPFASTPPLTPSLDPSTPVDQLSSHAEPYLAGAINSLPELVTLASSDSHPSLPQSPCLTNTTTSQSFLPALGSLSTTPPQHRSFLAFSRKEPSDASNAQNRPLGGHPSGGGYFQRLVPHFAKREFVLESWSPSLKHEHEQEHEHRVHREDHRNQCEETTDDLPLLGRDAQDAATGGNPSSLGDSIADVRYVLAAPSDACKTLPTVGEDREKGRQDFEGVSYQKLQHSPSQERHFKPIKRLPHPKIAVTRKIPSALALQSSSNQFSVKKDGVSSTSSLSLSKIHFPKPPELPTSRNAHDIATFPAQRENQQPDSNITVRYSGTSFDLLNPRDSLLLSVIQPLANSTARMPDKAHPTSLKGLMDREVSRSQEELPPPRRRFGNLEEAHRAISNPRPNTALRNVEASAASSPELAINDDGEFTNGSNRREVLSEADMQNLYANESRYNSMYYVESVAGDRTSVPFGRQTGQTDYSSEVDPSALEYAHAASPRMSRQLNPDEEHSEQQANAIDTQGGNVPTSTISGIIHNYQDPDVGVAPEEDADGEDSEPDMRPLLERNNTPISYGSTSDTGNQRYSDVMRNLRQDLGFPPSMPQSELAPSTRNSATDYAGTLACFGRPGMPPDVPLPPIPDGARPQPLFSPRTYAQPSDTMGASYGDTNQLLGMGPTVNPYNALHQSSRWPLISSSSFQPTEEVEDAGPSNHHERYADDAPNAPQIPTIWGRQPSGPMDLRTRQSSRSDSWAGMSDDDPGRDEYQLEIRQRPSHEADWETIPDPPESSRGNFTAGHASDPGSSRHHQQLRERAAEQETLQFDESLAAKVSRMVGRPPTNPFRCHSQVIHPRNPYLLADAELSPEPNDNVEYDIRNSRLPTTNAVNPQGSSFTNQAYGAINNNEYDRGLHYHETSVVSPLSSSHVNQPFSAGNRNQINRAPPTRVPNPLYPPPNDPMLAPVQDNAYHWQDSGLHQGSGFRSTAFLSPNRESYVSFNDSDHHTAPGIQVPPQIYQSPPRVRDKAPKRTETRQYSAPRMAANGFLRNEAVRDRRASAWVSEPMFRRSTMASSIGPTSTQSTNMPFNANSSREPLRPARTFNSLSTRQVGSQEFEDIPLETMRGERRHARPSSQTDDVIRHATVPSRASDRPTSHITVTSHWGNFCNIWRQSVVDPPMPTRMPADIEQARHDANASRSYQRYKARLGPPNWHERLFGAHQPGFYPSVVIFGLCCLVFPFLIFYHLGTFDPVVRSISNRQGGHYTASGCRRYLKRWALWTACTLFAITLVILVFVLYMYKKGFLA